MATPSPSHDRIQQMQALVDKYSANFPTPTFSPLDPSTVPHYGECVLLTGSTGALGTYLLAELIKGAGVRQIYAFNRPSQTSSLLVRQTASLVDHGLDPQLALHPKVVLLEGLTTEPSLGLHELLYEEIRSTVTCIIHAAWPLGFNRHLLSFEPNIAGTRNLLNLALGSVRGCHFIFSSSTSTVANWDGEGPVPEKLHDARVARMGYGESKWVVERILEQASEQRGLPTTVFRLGQFAGSITNGAWNMTEWIPRIIQTGYNMRKLPLVDDSQIQSWVPVDIVAAVMVEVLLQPTQRLSRILSVAYTSPCPWNVIMKYFGDYMGILGRTVQYVPCDAWLHEVEILSSAPSASSTLSASRLLGFLRGCNRPPSEAYDAMGMPKLETTEIRKVSRVLREVPVLTRRDVERWMRYWASHGMFGEEAPEGQIRARL